MKIAIFIYERGLQVHHYNFVKGFVDRGDEVYLFMHDADEFNFKLQNFKKIKVHLHSYYDSLSLRKRVQNKFSRIFQRYFNVSKQFQRGLVISNNTIEKSKKITANLGRIELAVGFEKKGLIWAGKLFENSKTKLVYYSLELYEDGHHFFLNDPTFPLVRDNERYFHQKCDATIIQDPERCKFLYEINNINDQKTLFLPVSVTREMPLLVPEFLHNKIGQRNVQIVLYFGRIDDHRRCFEISKGFSQLFSKDFTLVLNGDGNKEYISGLLELSSNILHFDKSPEKFIDSIINDGYIGLVTYDYKSKNDELTVFASEKLAYYLKHRKPVIAYSNPQYDKFFKDYKCGIAIRDSGELWDAITTIRNNYSSFQKEAERAFEDFFCFENRFELLYTEINNVITGDSFNKNEILELN